MDHSTSPSSPVDPSCFTYVVGIEIGSQTCSFCTLKPDKSQVIKPTDFTNAPAGFALLLDKLERLGVSPEQILIGLEATSRDAGESLPLSGEPRVSTVSVASPANPSVCPTTGTASENGQTGCHDDCACVAQRGGSPWLCADGLDRDLPGVGPAADAVNRGRHTLAQRDPRAAASAVSRVQSSLR